MFITNNLKTVGRSEVAMCLQGEDFPLKSEYIMEYSCETTPVNVVPDRNYIADFLAGLITKWIKLGAGYDVKLLSDCYFHGHLSLDEKNLLGELIFRALYKEWVPNTISELFLSK